MHGLHQGAGEEKGISGLVNGKGSRYDVTSDDRQVARTPFEIFNVEAGKRYR